MIGLHQRAMAKRSRSASMTAPTKLRPTPASPTSTPNPARPTNWVKISPKTDTETPHTATAVCGVSVSVFGLILTQLVGLAGFGVLVGLAGVGLSFVGAVIE